MKKVFSSPLTKVELEQQRAEIDAQMTPLYKQLKAIDNALAELAANEEQAAIDALSKEYGVHFEVGKEFIVTQAIADYAKERHFGDGAYRSWLVGQKAVITDIDPESIGKPYAIRADCFTGHSYRQGIGLNEKQRNEEIPLKSLNTPFPIELIAEALRGD